MCSVLMNRFHRHWPDSPSVIQTIMPLRPPSASTVVYRSALQRPVVDSHVMGAQERLAALHQQPGRRLWYVGSYAAPGVPLLESGVVSAKRVCEQMIATGKLIAAGSSSPVEE